MKPFWPVQPWLRAHPETGSVWRPPRSSGSRKIECRAIAHIGADDLLAIWAGLRDPSMVDTAHMHDE
eukprot:5930442-Alexandrium_andersonii.AAC.1